MEKIFFHHGDTEGTEEKQELRKKQKLRKKNKNQLRDLRALRGENVLLLGVSVMPPTSRRRAAASASSRPCPAPGESWHHLGGDGRLPQRQLRGEQDAGHLATQLVAQVPLRHAHGPLLFFLRPAQSDLRL